MQTLAATYTARPVVANLYALQEAYRAAKHTLWSSSPNTCGYADLQARVERLAAALRNERASVASIPADAR